MADNLPKTYDELTGTKSGSYEEALASSRLRNGGDTMEPKPDTPTGAAVHVNTATDPAPIWNEVRRPEPVPVINDPGLVGVNPSLAELNAAARAAGAPARPVLPLAKREAPPETDATSGITEEGQQEAIKAAAEDRQKRLLDAAKEDARTAVSSAKDDAKPAKGSKIGSASKA